MPRYRTRVRKVDAIQYKPSLDDATKADWGICMDEACVHQTQDEHIHNPSHILFPESGQWILRFPGLFELMVNEEFLAYYEEDK